MGKTGEEADVDRAELISRFRLVRAKTEALSAPLSPEDQNLQSMPECSPTKWHRAHTSWFFETFLLEPRGIMPLHPSWGPLFNSYYVAVGPRNARPKRGMLSRPSADEVARYRRDVDARVCDLVERADRPTLLQVAPTLALGLAHEEQHQELLLTDILNAFHQNPLRPAYAKGLRAPAQGDTRSLEFRPFAGGVHELGMPPSPAFRFDNEEPRHRVFLEPFLLANRLVTVGEWKAFRRDGGYATPSLWLSEGFDWVRANEVIAPLYAALEGDSLVAFGLGGTRELHDHEPIAHVSYYEADAIARFLGARLPTEAEWECAARTVAEGSGVGAFLEDEVGYPRPSDPSTLAQLFGDAWEWTSSAYSPYPGFMPRPGAVGEYNGKFMANQFVLRGGSCFTPKDHIRPTYRNFWHPHTRFQMTGFRLAKAEAA